MCVCACLHICKKKIGRKEKKGLSYSVFNYKQQKSTKISSGEKGGLILRNTVSQGNLRYKGQFWASWIPVNNNWKAVKEQGSFSFSFTPFYPAQLL